MRYIIWTLPEEWPIKRDFKNTISGVGQSDTVTFKYPAAMMLSILLSAFI